MLPDSDGGRPLSPVHFSSVKVSGDRTLIAASPGYGIYRKSGGGEWSALSDGLPEGTTVNRLQMTGGSVYACTSRGLYRLERSRWVYDEVGYPCYQYKEEWGYGFAATHSGLFYKAESVWKESAFEHSIVYDFLFTPQFLYVGLDRGISMYDRLTDSWASFAMGKAITSLAASRDRLYGASESGELIYSNGRGGFESVRFGDIFVYSVASKYSRVYVCTDRGLYRIGYPGSGLTLFSIKPGVPVTDIDWHGTELYMATLSKGVQMMRTEPWRSG